MTYTLSDEKRKTFATRFLLQKMIKKTEYYPLLLEGDDTHLEDILAFMMAKGYVEIHNDREYRPTEQGKKAHANFKQRYQDFLKNFDIYCAVDLEEGDFAFEDYWEYDEEEETKWNALLEEERWEDLRVAVAAFKGLDPLEIVFMGLLNEERINDQINGWQFDLALGTIWDEILKICNSALNIDQLAYEDDEGERVSGEIVLKDIIGQASKINQDLWQEEAQQQANNEDHDDHNDHNDHEVYTEWIEPVIYVSYINDPYYVNPVWHYYDY